MINVLLIKLNVILIIKEVLGGAQGEDGAVCCSTLTVTEHYQCVCVCVSGGDCGVCKDQGNWHVRKAV